MKRLFQTWMCLLMLLPLSLHAANNDSEVLLLLSTKAKAKVQLLEQLAQQQPYRLAIISDLGKQDSEELARRWGAAKLVLLDGLSPELSRSLFGRYQNLLRQHAEVPVVALGNIDDPTLNQGVSASDASNLNAYFSHGGRENYRNMLHYLASKLLEVSAAAVPPAIPVPTAGFYHPAFPGLVSADGKAFFDWLPAAPGKPLIALAIHRSVVDYEHSEVVDSLLQGLQARGASAFAFFFEESDQVQDFRQLFANAQQVPLSLVINYRSMHYAEKRRQEFELLGVPVIQAINYNEGDEAHFRQAQSGVSASLTPFYLVMPEDSGAIDPVVIAAGQEGVLKPIAEQLQALIERAYRHARLGLIDNAEKKIATFIWNYPPGEHNIGAAFLDVPSSLVEISAALKAEGYRIEEQDAQRLIEQAGQLLRAYYRNESKQELVAKGLAEHLPLRRYLAWFNALPATVQAPIIERWGRPEDVKALVSHQGEPSFVIPRLLLGNMIVLPQGLRGESEQESSVAYHDTRVAINHSYLATYLYVREAFGADAIIHLDTHGSQEWLDGKERGLSAHDAPNLAVGELPVFYPYIIDNVGEAMQAKRRGRATTISHLTPGFARAGLYAGVAELAEALSDYALLDEGQTRNNTRNRIIALFKQHNVLQDLQLSEEALYSDFDQYLDQLERYLGELARQSQPLGVHIFGQLPRQAHLYSTILQILGEDFAHEAAAYERSQGLALEAALRTEASGELKLEALDGFQLLKAFIAGEPLPGLSASLQQALDEGRVQLQRFGEIAELESLLAALSGKYIEISHGGDPIRNPQVAPTGRNLVGFNPAKVPSPAAYQAGVELIEQTIADYRARHGRYPEKLAFSLWSLETMRHQGALEAQIMQAIGVKPVWNRHGQVSDLEIIPHGELKRPRIDVVVSATGLYRDAFPNLILRLSTAIDKIARLNENNNFLHRNRLSLRQQLLDEGRSEEDADYLSTVRIFSNQSGRYGTGLAGTVLDSGRWDDESAMAETYLQRMGFAYGRDDRRWGERVDQNQLYGKVLAGTDSVIFSRSTNLYALMTNDDPFQYFGGLGQAIRHLDGKTPEMYVSNLRRTDDIKVQTLENFLSQEFRSRYFHPRWIKAMQEAGYAGALTMLDRMNNMWGWEVMTPEAIRDDHWQTFFEIYVEDQYELGLQAFFEQYNADALAQILERMLEAVRKDYWAADAATLRRMVELYTELANEHGLFTRNENFRDYVNEQAGGFGLARLAAASASVAASAGQSVQGQQLQEVEHDGHEEQHQLWLLIGLVFAAGLIAPCLQRRPQQ